MVLHLHPCLSLYRYVFMGDIFTACREHTHTDRESNFPWEESCASYLGTYKSYNAQAFCS